MELGFSNLKLATRTVILFNRATCRFYKSSYIFPFNTDLRRLRHDVVLCLPMAGA